MKRVLLILALAVSATTMFAQDAVKVYAKDGLVIAGHFICGTDSTYTIKCTNDIRPYVIKQYGTDTVTFRMVDINYVHMYGKVFVPIDGKLTPQEIDKSTQQTPINSPDQKLLSTYMPQPSNPNYVIGKALKSTGGVAIGAGIPCLLAGTILLAVGSHVPEVDFGNGYLSDKEKFDKLEAASKNAEAKGKMQLAGCILLPVGASLTIVGIPLYAHGKKIMNMNFNYTSNGVGLAMEF